MAKFLGIDELIELPSLSDAQISPRGDWIAYVVSKADWERNQFRRETHIASVSPSREEVCLPELFSSSSPRWTPDGKALWVVGRRSEGDPAALYRLSWPDQAIKEVVLLPPGAHRVSCSPDGAWFACIAPASASPEEQAFRDRYGAAHPADAPRGRDALWLLAKGGHGFLCVPSPGHVTEIAWRPDSEGLALVLTETASPEDWDRGRLARVNVITRGFTDLPVGEGCGAPVWSPSGDRLAFKRSGRPSFLANNELVLYTLETGETIHRPLLDEEIHPIAWRKEGIYFLSLKHASSHLFRWDPERDRTSCITEGHVGADRGFALLEGWGSEGCTFTADGEHLAAVCHAPEAPGEVAVLDVGKGTARYVTRRRSSRCEGRLPSSELLRWTTSDGEEIEGVLHRDPSQSIEAPRPLVVVLHGGPTALSFHAPLCESDWKLSAIPILVERGAMVLRPNYRGSSGYGERFRGANVRGLGRVNEEDVLSGIDRLADRGWVDPARVAVTGASHGGYLSAFVAVHTSRFVAAVMQCGISDWALNYGCNRQPDWERQYFRATPAEDPTLYADLSPISHAGTTRTPILILHGDSDRQAPTANALAFYRALKDQQVPTRLVLYGETGHGPSRPRELRHHMEEVVAWMDRWLFDLV